jgi:hypothetical protein
MFKWFRSKQKQRDDLEIERIFRKIDSFLESDAVQNTSLPDQLKQLVANGINCDQIPGATGEFGRTPTNPIPVNGPIGQILYLSRLRTADTNHPVMFHRISSVPVGNGNVDMYEVLSTDERCREYLFLSLYHPRKSSLAPRGYKLAKKYHRENPIYGVNFTVEKFPQALDIKIRELQATVIASLPLNNVRVYLYGNKHGPET